MTKLTDEQIEFLGYHGIPLDRVFDASGMRTKDYKDAMRQSESWVAYGVTPCKEAGHTLRSRAGHCIQCDPAKITYIKKNVQGGLIYVAWSDSKGLVKVGVTNNTTKRVALLNSEMYGGAFDWKLMRAWQCDQAGKFEAAAHRELASYTTTGYYLKNDMLTECNELFKCSYQRAVEIVSQIVEPSAKHTGKVVSIPDRNTAHRVRMLPTTVALHVVHQGLKLAGQSDNGLSDRKIRQIRNLAESILSAISHGLRDQVVSVPQDCIDAYQELDNILDEFEGSS